MGFHRQHFAQFPLQIIDDMHVPILVLGKAIDNVINNQLEAIMVLNSVTGDEALLEQSLA